MPTYDIVVTDEAKVDLNHYPAFDRRTIVTHVRGQLAAEAAVESRRRKRLWDNLIATWELRIGRFRVFYEVDEAAASVAIVAVGHKEHNLLLIRGREVSI